MKFPKCDGNFRTWWRRNIYWRKCILQQPSEIASNINNKQKYKLLLQKDLQKANDITKLISPSAETEEIIADNKNYNIKDERTNSVSSPDSYFNNSSIIRPNSIESESDTFQGQQRWAKVGINEREDH